MESLLQDLRYAIRQLRRSPGFTVVAILTLALGIGANAAVFSLANWTLLRSPLPGISNYSNVVEIIRQGGFSVPDYRSFSAQVPGFTALAAQDDRRFMLALSGEGIEPRRLSTDIVSANYFSVLGVRMAAGRAFTPEEFTAAPQAPVAVLSHRVWMGAFAGDMGVVGRAIQLNGQRVTVTGIAPPGFQGVNRTTPSDLWVPYPAVTMMAGPFGVSRTRAEDLENPRVTVFTNLIGVLSPEASLSAVRTRAEFVADQLALANPALSEGDTFRRGPDNRGPAEALVIRSGIGLTPYVQEWAVDVVRVVSAISAIVLLIAVANVTNLMLFRAVRRREEFATRTALGATASRLARLCVIESVVLSLASSAVAVGVATGLLGLLRGSAVRGIPLGEIPLDGRVLAFGVGLATTVGLMIGLVVPLATRRVNLHAALKASGARGSGRQSPLRATMGVIQLASCLTLLVGALLLIGTLRNLRSVDLGFDPTGVSAYALDLSAAGYTPDRARLLHENGLARLREIRGVNLATSALWGPFGSGQIQSALWRDAVGTREQSITAVTAWVAPGYFDVLRIPLVLGRDFEPAAAFGANVADRPAVIGEGLAHELFGEQAPLGQTFVGGTQARPERYRVTGVTGDSRWGSVTGRARGILYLPIGIESFFTIRSATFLVRSAAPTGALQADVRRALGELAPDIPVIAEDMNVRVERSIAEQALFARVMSMLTGLAVLLAAIGLYALVAFSVAARRREFGIRLALGAPAREIRDLVVKQGALLAGIGLPLGLAGAVVLSRLIASRLFGIQPLEFEVYLLAAGLLALLTLVACIVPARAATKVDPVTALRSE